MQDDPRSLTEDTKAASLCRAGLAG